MRAFILWPAAFVRVGRRNSIRVNLIRVERRDAGGVTALEVLDPAQDADQFPAGERLVRTAGREEVAVLQGADGVPMIVPTTSALVIQIPIICGLPVVSMCPHSLGNRGQAA